MNLTHNPFKKIEVLAPAGSRESLEAAVRCGADAVYLGGSAFSARANAKNFTNSELSDAVKYCHARGVKVYLTVNTLLLEHELQPAMEFIKFACSLPVDALLVQDPGLLRLVQQAAPNMPIHASTQMSIHTPAGTRLLWQCGLERVVLARELSLGEMKAISESCSVELETFVHGAQCMSVSGQCYFSSVLGSRSGNRGLCAQPCRLPFSASGGTGHDLSLKDLSMITRMDELQKAGIISAKIEGRMKRPEYVAAAVACCRESADGKSTDPILYKNLESVFSRSGFTSGYPDGKLGVSMFGTRTKQDVTSATNEVFSSLRSLYRTELSRIPVKFTVSIRKNLPVSLTVSDGTNKISVCSEVFPQTALHRAIDETRCREQLQKTGGTPFFTQEIECFLDEGLSIPISLLNKLRRDSLDKLMEQRSKRRPIQFTMPTFSISEHRAKPFALRARFTSPEQVPPAAKKCELIYLPLHTPLEALQNLKKQGFQVGLELPRAFFGGESFAKNLLQERMEKGFTQVRCGHIGAVALAKECKATIHGASTLNITNSESLEWFESLGLTSAELSFELTLGQSARIGGNIPRGILVYGRIPMMLCRNCPAANSPKGCLNCKTPPVLTDRKGICFPISCTRTPGYRFSEILNSVPVSLADRQHEIKNQDFGLFRFSVENSVETDEIISAFIHGINPHSDYTRGLFYRGVE